VANPRLAAPDPAGDLCDGEAGVDQRLEVRTCERPLGSNAISVSRRKTIFRDPIPNRGFMPAHPPADLRQRQALGEQALE
jgi:hypothetical protein